MCTSSASAHAFEQYRVPHPPAQLKRSGTLLPEGEPCVGRGMLRSWMGWTAPSVAARCWTESDSCGTPHPAHASTRGCMHVVTRGDSTRIVDPSAHGQSAKRPRPRPSVVARICTDGAPRAITTGLAMLELSGPVDCSRLRRASSAESTSLRRAFFWLPQSCQNSPNTLTGAPFTRNVTWSSGPTGISQDVCEPPGRRVHNTSSGSPVHCTDTSPIA